MQKAQKNQNTRNIKAKERSFFFEGLSRLLSQKSIQKVDFVHSF